MLRKFVAFGIVLLFLGASWMAFLGVNVSVVAVGATVYVDDGNTDGPWDGTVLHPYQNITSGIEHASDGDTVLVLGGTYVENVVVDKSVTLRGDSKPIINGLGGIGINITVYDNFVYGVAVDGFNITNCSYGIHLVMQDIAIDVTDFSVTIGDIILNNNTISSSSDGIFVDVHDVGVGMYGNSSVAIGDFRVTNNVINSSDQGIYFFHMEYFGDYMEGTSSFTMGNIELSGNIINSRYEGIFIYDISELGHDMYDDSSFAMGSILVNNNIIINSGIGAAGIYVDYIEYFGDYMHGASSFTMGNIEFSGNEIVSVDNGIHIGEISYFGSNTNNNAMFTMGSIRFDDNTISSGWYGIVVYNMLQFGWEMHGSSSVSMGNIEFCRNMIDSTVDALGFGNLRDFGIYMYDNSSFSMGSVLVNRNTLYSYIWLTSFGSFGSNLYGNSSFTMNDVEFTGNMIQSIGKAEDGITFYNLLPFGHEMHSHSAFTMGDFSVSSNTIVADGDRFGIACTQGSGGFGINIYDNASAVTGDFEFAGNNISFTRLGFNLWMVEGARIRGNTVRNSTDIGIFLPESTGNLVYHNNIINNTVQAYVTPNYNNTWDNGYPSGGNYWSDYTGADLYSGPYQNISGSDFRGDTPYVINQNNTDHYPLAIPYETTPPTIIILSPENTTYAVDTDIQLTFTLDEPVDWIGYSLDGQAVVTITGNTTLPALSVGGHHVTVYANDTFNNMGVSIVYFSVFDFTDPVANAGSDRTVNEDVLITLDGSGSNDNVGIISYTWTFTDVTVKTLTGDKPTYTFNNPGVFTITLNVTDAAGNWATDTVTITVLDITNPVANAGEDQTVNVGETVTFDADSSADNVGIVSYEWNFGDQTSGTGKTVTHTYAEAGIYTVTLAVEDAAGNQATDTMVVTVNPVEAFPWWIVAAAGIIAVGVAVVAVIVWRRRKKV